MNHRPAVDDTRVVDDLEQPRLHVELDLDGFHLVFLLVLVVAAFTTIVLLIIAVAVLVLVLLVKEVVEESVARSVAGGLLEQIYLETRRGLELQSQGGARAKVKEVTLEAIETEHASTRAAPEAGYYAGVALFMQGKRDMAALKLEQSLLLLDAEGNPLDTGSGNCPIGPPE